MSRERTCFLCISNTHWEGDYAKAIVQLMSTLARDNDVIYVDNPYTLKDLASSLFSKKKFPKASIGLAPRVRKITQENGGIVHVFTTPPILPVNFLPAGNIYDLLMKFNGWIITRSVRKYLKVFGVGDKLVNIVAFTPSLGVVCGRKFNESLLLYHCYDNIAAAPYLKKHGPRAEERFMKMVDATIVTSTGLYERKKDKTPACYLVKNGVDFTLFNKALPSQKKDGKPFVIGYVGSMDDRLDYQLLDFVIGKMPDYKFVFVGRVLSETGRGMLLAHSNVTMLPSRDLHELPELLATFNAGIIPFALNEFNKSVYPLKINEYLATGLPVISTNFADLSDFTDVITLASDYTDFAHKLAAACADDTVEKKQYRAAFASKNSWQSRASEITGIVNQLS